MQNTLLDKIKQAELILVGIGEEFNDMKQLRQIKGYTEAQEYVKASENAWLLPALNAFYEKKMESAVNRSLNKLAELLKNKNYFVVSVATNDKIAEAAWKEGRLVMPCGSGGKKQCAAGCEHILYDVTEENRKTMWNYFQKSLQQYSGDLKAAPEADYVLGFEQWQNGAIGVCPECGRPLVLNNIYAENYNENGYLEQWKQYTKWLQGTLNRNLLVLELGVGMQFPSVIRWPFEKVAFFNQKAEFYRINEKLYQLSEELSGKGTAIAQNAIDWLQTL